MRQMISIDIGSANTRIFRAGEGILLNEPTLVAVDKTSGEVVCTGEAARRMVGKTPINIEIIRPVRGGVIHSFQYTSLLLDTFIKQVLPSHPFYRPDVVFTFPEGITDLEQRAFCHLFEKSFPFAHAIYMIPATCAAAAGLSLPIELPSASMVLLFGAGMSSLSVFTLGSRAVSMTRRLGSDDLDEGIVTYVRQGAHIEIGWKMAETIKRSVAAALYDQRNNRDSFPVTGRDQLSSLPRNFDITKPQASEAIREELSRLSDFVKEGFERTLPDLCADLFHQGFWLVGGGALLSGLDSFLSQETGVPVHLAEEPQEIPVMGACMALSDPEKYGAYLRPLRTLWKR